MAHAGDPVDHLPLSAGLLGATVASVGAQLESWRPYLLLGGAVHRKAPDTECGRSRGESFSRATGTAKAAKQSTPQLRRVAGRVPGRSEVVEVDEGCEDVAGGVADGGAEGDLFLVVVVAARHPFVAGDEVAEHVVRLS